MNDRGRHCPCGRNEGIKTMFSSSPHLIISDVSRDRRVGGKEGEKHDIQANAMCFIDRSNNRISYLHEWRARERGIVMTAI